MSALVLVERAGITMREPRGMRSKEALLYPAVKTNARLILDRASKIHVRVAPSSVSAATSG